MDPNFLNNQALECVVPESEDVVVVALMIRELGGAACPEVHGNMVRSVVGTSDQAPEYAWTEL